MHHIEATTLAVKAAIGFAVAGASALGAIASATVGDSLPPWTERILDVGFAGVFIVALIYALRMERMARIKSDEKCDALEREIRDELKAELKAGNEARREMVQLMRRKESRDISE